MKEKKILVTGATGILGSYIVSDLVSSGFKNIYLLIRSGKLSKELLPFKDEVEVIKGDIQELYPLTDIISKVNYVIHAAAIVSFDPKEREMMTNINVGGTANVVNLCLDYDIKKLIHVSSVAALGRPERVGVIDESNTFNQSPYNPHYGLTKYKSEQEVWRAYTEGLQMAIVNPSIILGRGDYNRSSLKMIKLIQRGLSHYPIGSVGIVDARDVARLCTYLLNSNISGERYIATADSITYKLLFEKIAKYLGVKPPRKAMSTWMGAVLWRVEKLRSLVTGSSPIVTKETMASASYPAKYDTSKSLSLDGFSYRPVEETIKWSSEGLLASEKYSNND